MAFLIRSLTRSATGREIARSRRVEADRLTIGRDPASDIQLEDLEVTLHHAVIHRAGPRRVTIVAVAGIPITVDGKSVENAGIDVARGAEITIAGYHLTIAYSDAEDAIDVLVQRTGVVASSAEKKDERVIFSLKGKLPGRRVMAWTGALLVLALFLAWPIWSFHAQNNSKLTPEQLAAVHTVGDTSWSPGPLSSPHANLEHNCKACHAKAFVSVRDESCRTCHAKVHDHADPARLARALAPNDWQGKLKLAVAHAFNRPEGRCIDCHIEHQSASVMPPAPQKFCSDCHGDLKAKLPDSRLADARDFAAQHPQFQPAILITPGKDPVYRRISLDDNPRENTGLKFPHALHLSMTNGVARMAQTLGQVPSGKGLDCASCHTPDPAGEGFKPVTMEANCQSCHSLAFEKSGGMVRTLRHGDPAEVVAELRDYYAANGPSAATDLGGMARRRPGDFAAAQVQANVRSASAIHAMGAAGAIRAVFSPGGACYDCHVVVPPKAGGLDYGIAPVTLPRHYLVDGWFDHRAHATQSCTSCHAANKSNDAHDVMQPKLAECRTCHSGEHATRAAPVASTCAMCHVYHRDPGLPESVDRRKPGAAAGIPERKRQASGM